MLVQGIKVIGGTWGRLKPKWCLTYNAILDFTQTQVVTRFKSWIGKIIFNIHSEKKKQHYYSIYSNPIPTWLLLLIVNKSTYHNYLLLVMLIL